MNKGKEIYFWHGFNKQVYDTLLPICVESFLSNGKEGLIYYGSLDDFERHYGKPFIVAEYYIGVTHKKRFT